MNILFLARDYKPNLGGVAEYTHELATQLSASGHEVTVISKKMEGCEEFDGKSGIRTIRMETDNLGGVADKLKLAYEIFRNVGKTRRDVVVMNYMEPFRNKDIPAWRLRNIPAVLIAHGMEVLYPGSSLARRLKVRLYFSMVRRFIANSSFTKSILVGKHNISEDRIGVVNPGVREDIFVGEGEGARESGGSPVVLTVGRLVERKGVDMVIQAFPRVLERVPGAEYAVIGEGPDRERLEELARSLGLGEKVRFLGEVSEAEKFQWYDRCSLFIMPSRQTADSVEGFGIVFLEAGARKKPVIAGNSGGMPDAVSPGDTGYLVDPMDKGEMAERMVTLLENPDLAREMGEKGWKRAREKFVWKNLGAVFEKELALALGSFP